MQPLTLAYLVHDAGVRLAFFEEHSRRAAELGHIVTLVNGARGALPSADFLLATGAESAVRAVEAGIGLPIHWVLDSPRTTADPEALDRALRLASFKLTTDARIQQQLQRRYRSRCWCLPDPESPQTDRRVTALARDAWRILLVGEGSEDELQRALDSIRIVRERGFALGVARMSSGSPSEIEVMSGQLDRWLGDASSSARRALYRNIDVVLVVGNDVAGLGREAMAHGPCVLRIDTSDPGAPARGLETSVEEWEQRVRSGALHVPQADTTGGADALERILGDDAFRMRLAESARRVSGRRGWTDHFDRFQSVLDEIAVTYGSTYGHDRKTAPSSPIRSLDSAVLDRQIEFAESLVQDRHVTVIGCGQTDIAVRLAEHGADSVTALEPSDVALAHALRHRAHPNVCYEKLGALEIEPTDVVIALDPLARSIDAASVVRSAAVRLNPGGALLLSAPARGERDAGADPSLAFGEESWLDRHLPLLQESFQKVIPLGQCDVAGDLVIGPEHIAPESLSYLLLAIHPTRANPPDAAATRAPSTLNVRDLRSESRKRGRAA
jgi:SAM-dependent methyltransferase